MWAIITLDEIGFLEKEKALVSVLLAENYDNRLIDWVSAAWQDLHIDSGMKWHIAVPCYDTTVPEQIYNLVERPKPKRYSDYYDSRLSRQIMDMYGISDKHSPVLVIDDFNEERHQRYISLSDATEHDLKQTFKRAANFLDELPSPPYSNSDRATYSDQLVDVLLRGQAVDELIKNAPKAFSIVGAAGRLIT